MFSFISTDIFWLLLSSDVCCGSVLGYNQHFTVIIVTSLIIYDILYEAYILSSFFEYKTVPLVLDTEEGNMTVFTALPTDLRLHPTYSKVTNCSWRHGDDGFK